MGVTVLVIRLGTTIDLSLDNTISSTGVVSTMVLAVLVLVWRMSLSWILSLLLLLLTLVLLGCLCLTLLVLLLLPLLRISLRILRGRIRLLQCRLLLSRLRGHSLLILTWCHRWSWDWRSRWSWWLLLLRWLLVLLRLTLLLWHTDIHSIDRCLSTLSVLILQVLSCTLGSSAGIWHAAIVPDWCWSL